MVLFAYKNWVIEKESILKFNDLHRSVTSLREPEPGYFRGSQDILEGARASIKKYRKLEPEPVNPIKTTPGSQEPGAGAC